MSWEQNSQENQNEWAESVMTHHPSILSISQRLIYGNRSRLSVRSMAAHCMSVICPLTELSASMNFNCHLPVLYTHTISTHQSHHTLPLPAWVRKQTQQSVTHLHASRCWRFCLTEIIHSPANLKLAALCCPPELKSTQPSVHAWSWLKWHVSFLLSLLYLRSPLFPFFWHLLNINSLSDGERNKGLIISARMAGQRSRVPSCRSKSGIEALSLKASCL